VSDSLTSSIEPESKQPALSERELLDLYESPDLFKSIVGGDAFNTIEEIDPDYVNKFIVSNYLSESHNINNAQILGNYESYAKSIGLTGIPANDANDIAFDIRRTQRLSLQEVEPVTFTEGVSGAAQRGVQNLSQLYSLMGISDPTYQSLIDGKISEINQLDKVLKSELNVKVKERARRQQESARQFVAGTLLFKSNEIKSFINAQSKIESAKLSEGYKSFVDSGNIPTSPKAFGEFLVGFMTEQFFQQAPTALKTMASGFAGSPAVLATVFSESLHQERAFEMMQHLRESGINFDDQESLNAALSNDKLMSDAMLRGMNKSLPIAITSALSAYLPIKGKTVLGKLGREVATQAGLDSIGEVLGQSFATGEVDIQEVMLEVLGGTTQSVAEFSTKIAANVAKSPINSILKNEDGSIKSRKEVVALSEYLPDDFAEEITEADPLTGNLVVEAIRGNSESYDSLVPIIRAIEEAEVEVSPELKKLSNAVNELESVNAEIETSLDVVDETVGVELEAEGVSEMPIRPGDPRDKGIKPGIEKSRSTREERLKQAKNNLSLLLSERIKSIKAKHSEKVKKLREQVADLKREKTAAVREETAMIRDVASQVSELWKAIPVSIRGKTNPIGSVVNASTLEGRLSALDKFAERVNKAIEKDFKQTREKTLKYILKKATEGDAKAVSKRLGLNAEIVEKINQITKASNEDNQAAMLEELSKLPEGSEEGQLISTLYSAFSDLKSKNSKELNGAIALVEQIIKYGKDWRKQFNKKKAAERRKLRGDFLEEIGVIDPTKEEKALPEAEVKRLIKEDDPTVTTLPSGEKAEITPGEPEAWKKVKPPKKSVKGYKLFRIDPNQPGKLFPLFVDSKTAVIAGEWVEAIIGEQAAGKVKSTIGKLAFRPGWHAGDLPVATHIGERTDAQKKAAAEVDAQRLEAYKKEGIDPKGAKDKAARAKINKEFPYPKGTTTPSVRPPNHVWAEVEMSDDVDWQTEANSRAERNKAGNIIARTAHIQDVLPKKGHYRYKTNSNMTGSWLISGEMKVVRVLSDSEVSQTNKEAGVADLPREKPGITELQKPLLPEALKSQQELIPEFLSDIKDSKELTQEQKEFVEKIQEMGHNLEFSKSDGRVIEGRLHGTAQKGPKGKSIITIADGLVPDQQIHSIGHELVHAQLAKLSPDLRSKVFSMVKELVNDKSFINAVKENWDLEKGSRGDLQAFEEILAEHGGRVLTRNKSTLGGAFNKVKDLFYKVSEIIIDLAEFAFRGKSSLKLDELASAIIDLDVDRIESITADQEVTVIAGYPESDIQLSFFKQKKKRKPDVLMSKEELANKQNLAGVFKEWLDGADWYLSAHDGIEQLIENLIRVPGKQYAGKLHDQITKPAFKAAEKFLTRQRTMRESAFDAFNKVLKDQGLSQEQIKDLFMGLRKAPNFKKGDSTGVYFKSEPGYSVKEQPITQDQAIQLWMWRQDKTLQGSFDAMQWTDQVDAQLESYIGKEGIALAEYMMSVYKQLGVEMNDVLFEVEGWKLPIVENYSPVSKKAKNAVLDIDESMKDGIVRSTEKNNSMKLRVDEKAPLDATHGALAVFDRHISEMNHYITHGEVASRMRNLFSDDRVKRAIVQIYGPQRVKLIMHMLDNFTKGGIDRSRIDPFVNKLIRNIAVGKLALNFPSAVKQLGSIPAYANAMPATEWAAGFASFFVNLSSSIKTLLETDYIKNRITTTGDRDLRAIAESKSFQQAATGIKNWRDRLMILTRLGDVGAIMAGGWPIYKKTYDDAIAAGKSVNEAKKMAEFEFGFVSDRSQQSSKPQNLSYFQSSGSFAKLFTMFMTSPIQYMRITTSAARAAYKGRIGKREAIKTFAIYHVILPQIFTAMGSMGIGIFSDDEEKQEAWKRRQWNALALGNLNSLFLIGDGIDAVLGSIIKDENFYDLSNPVVSELSTIVRAASNIDKEGKLTDLVGSMALLMGGIPYDTISREFEAKYELTQGDDVWQNIWGISDYAAFETQKKKKKKKSTSSYYFND
jgi:hypothetical protein